jgi:hypothetical protein
MPSLQVYDELEEIEKAEFVDYYCDKIVSDGDETRALAVTCTSRKHSHVFGPDYKEERWLLRDPIDARNSMMVAPWTISNSIHNLKVSLGMSGSACAGLGSCTCLD